MKGCQRSIRQRSKGDEHQVYLSGTSGRHELCRWVLVAQRSRVKVIVEECSSVKCIWADYIRTYRYGSPTRVKICITFVSKKRTRDPHSYTSQSNIILFLYLPVSKITSTKKSKPMKFWFCFGRKIFKKNVLSWPDIPAKSAPFSFHIYTWISICKIKNA